MLGGQVRGEVDAGPGLAEAEILVLVCDGVVDVGHVVAAPRPRRLPTLLASHRVTHPACLPLDPGVIPLYSLPIPRPVKLHALASLRIPYQ